MVLCVSRRRVGEDGGDATLFDFTIGASVGGSTNADFEFGDDGDEPISRSVLFVAIPFEATPAYVGDCADLLTGVTRSEAGLFTAEACCKAGDTTDDVGVSVRSVLFVFVFIVGVETDGFLTSDVDGRAAVDRASSLTVVFIDSVIAADASVFNDVAAAAPAFAVAVDL